jgi:hypothetical protein
MDVMMPLAVGHFVAENWEAALAYLLTRNPNIGESTHQRHIFHLMLKQIG